MERIRDKEPQGKSHKANRQIQLLAIGYWLFPLLILFGSSCNSENKDTSKKKLPIYGNREVDEKGDTIYHTVGNFALKNQEGETITSKMLDGKIYVADFFFTSCPNVCPKMTTQMKRFAAAFKDNDNVRIISFTVDPKRDTVAKLKKFADKFGIHTPQWNLLTGDRSEIYELGVYGYLLSAQEDALAPGGFLHSSQMVLIDKQKRIRGSYEGTKTKDVDRMIEDAKLLLEE